MTPTELPIGPNPPVPASVAIRLGKEVQDLFQAWIDPDMTKGKISEIKDLAPTLWDAAKTYPQLRDKRNLRVLMAWAGGGIALETLREYQVADADGCLLIQWDLHDGEGAPLLVE